MYIGYIYLLLCVCVCVCAYMRVCGVCMYTILAITLVKEKSAIELFICQSKSIRYIELKQTCVFNYLNIN